MSFMDTGLVFNIQRYSVHDGPGIRTTVFLKGCPMACLWCHNPESQDARPQIMVMENRCIRCGQCATVCPAGEGTLDPAARAAECTRCGACVEACPTQARQMVGRTMNAREVLAEIRRDALFYDQSGGGVTFSGGEPLLQHRFLHTLVAACRAQEIHTVVDTTGCAPWEHLAPLVPVTNLFLYDIKVIDDTRHRRLIGVSNRLILENLVRLSEARAQMWIRIPLIPGMNDSDDDIDAVARLITPLHGIQLVSLLPYHDTGRMKFARLGKPYLLDKIEPSAPEALERAAERFRRHGFLTKVES